MDHLKRIPAILSGALASFFLLGFLQNFHPSVGAFVFFTVLFNLILTLLFEAALTGAIPALRKGIRENLIAVFVLALGFLWVALTFCLLGRYPELFSFDFFMPDARFIPAYVVLTVFAQTGALLLLKKLDLTEWRASPFVLWMGRSLPGLLPACAVTISTYALATAFVEVEPRFADNYFDTDSPFWLNFLTAPPDQMMPMRAVHPLALFILRPPVRLISLFLGGDTFHAALALNSLFGGVCVYLAWSFFKRRTGHTTHALLLASLLGFSTSHLLLSVFLESYIFSAAALLGFLMLLQSGREKLSQLVPVGLLAFGITITNFIQTCFALWFVRRRMKVVLLYISITLALAVPLAFAQNLLYPSSDPFYIPKYLLEENVYGHDLLETPARTVSRAHVLFRSIALFSVVAPRPFILLEEIGCTFPCFNTIRSFRGVYLYASYVGLGSLLARAWFVLLAVAAGIFVRNFFKSPRDVFLQAALVSNLLFNFVLHMNYGDDPLLYSPNWTYALVLFFGISFEKFADNKLFQTALFLFLAALMINNLDLFRKMLEAVLPFAP
jgi:hypothetical protein